MVEESFKKFVEDLCSDISWKDLMKKWGQNIGALIPFAGQYFAANMSSFEHEMQLRAIKKLVDAQNELKILLKEQNKDLMNIVRKYERTTYPFKIFNISQIEEIQGELNWNPRFVEKYLPLEEIEMLTLDKNILLKGKIGIGKTRSIFRLMEKMGIETVIVVKEYVKTLGVDRFENLDFQDKAILIWDDVQNSFDEFLNALPYLKTKSNILVIAAIRSTDYERIEKDVNIRERKLFSEVDLGLYRKERMDQFVKLCEKEFGKPLTDDLREALVEKALIGDSTPLYVASIFLKEKQITKNVIEKLPEDVVGLWAGYFRDLTSNEKCFMKALKAAKLGFSPPFKELIEDLYREAFLGESRDLADTVASLRREYWIVEIPAYYVCLDTQLECFQFEEADMKNLLKCLLTKELILEHHLQLLLGIGSHYYEAKNYDFAVELMNRAIKLKPNSAEAYNNRGAAYSDKGEFDRAIEDYGKALKLKPDYAEAYYNRGNAHYKEGHVDTALRDYEKCAISFLRKGAFPNAIFRFVQIFSLIPETENLKALCTECGLIAVFLMDRFKEETDSLEILKAFHYKDLESLLNDVYQQKDILTIPYSRALLHKLYRNLINESAEPLEFLTKEEIVALSEKLTKDIRDLFEEIEEEREKIILAALLG